MVHAVEWGLITYAAKVIIEQQKIHNKNNNIPTRCAIVVRDRFRTDLLPSAEFQTMGIGAWSNKL